MEHRWYHLSIGWQNGTSLVLSRTGLAKQDFSYCPTRISSEASSVSCVVQYGGAICIMCARATTFSELDHFEMALLLEVDNATRITLVVPDRQLFVLRLKDGATCWLV